MSATVGLRKRQASHRNFSKTPRLVANLVTVRGIEPRHCSDRSVVRESRNLRTVIILGIPAVSPPGLSLGTREIGGIRTLDVRTSAGPISAMREQCLSQVHFVSFAIPHG